MTTDKQPQKRLCAWHVNKNWTTHLSSVSNEPVEPEELTKSGKVITKRNKCKSHLFAVRCELDKNTMAVKLKNFLELLEKDTDYQKFKAYFKGTYGNRIDQWANAYLPDNGGFNTNMYLESWHRIFKYEYLDGSPQKRLDFVLGKLIEFDKDQQEEELRKRVFKPKSNK